MSEQHQENYRLPDGRRVIILIDDSGEGISVFDEKGAEIGAIRLRYDEDNHPPRYHLTWMYLDKQDGVYLRQGIGRRALELHKEIFAAPITAGEHDGIRQDDGSHLTGDAPGFVAAMRRDGLIEPASFQDVEGNVV